MLRRNKPKALPRIEDWDYTAPPPPLSFIHTALQACVGLLYTCMSPYAFNCQCTRNKTRKHQHQNVLAWQKITGSRSPHQLTVFKRCLKAEIQYYYNSAAKARVGYICCWAQWTPCAVIADRKATPQPFQHKKRYYDALVAIFFSNKRTPCCEVITGRPSDTPSVTGYIEPIVLTSKNLSRLLKCCLHDYRPDKKWSTLQ